MSSIARPHMASIAAHEGPVVGLQAEMRRDEATADERLSVPAA